MRKVLLTGVSALAFGFAGSAAAQELVDFDLDNSADVDVEVAGNSTIDADIDISGDSTSGVVTLYQSGSNDIEVDDDVIDGSAIGALFDARQTFGQAFDDNTAVTGAFNSGLNAVQQGGVGVGANGTNGDEALGVVAASQSAVNLLDMEGNGDEDFLENAGYNGALSLTDSFEDNVLTTGAVNSGINAAQQGGVALAASPNDAAVAAVVLSQVASNDVRDFDQLIDDGTITASMTITGSVDSSELSSYALNSGINAAQQGAVAVAGSASASGD